jgi:hypothetical protein
MFFIITDKARGKGGGRQKVSVSWKTRTCCFLFIIETKGDLISVKARGDGSGTVYYKLRSLL